MDNYDVNELMQFMNENITAYHAIENISNELGAKGFCEFWQRKLRVSPSCLLKNTINESEKYIESFLYRCYN